MKELDWNLYPNFSKSKFDCKHTDINDEGELVL